MHRPLAHRALSIALFMGLASCTSRAAPTPSESPSATPSTSNAPLAAQAPSQATAASSARPVAPPASPKCNVLSAKTGKPLPLDALERLHDPVALILVRGEGPCPTTFTEVQEKLKKLDAERCESPESGPVPGVLTRVVSERSQMMGTADRFRVVVSRQCGGRPAHGLFMSVFGVTSAQKSMPADVEIIARDEERGVLDFYAIEKGTITFFGDSTDLIAEGYTCEDGRCMANAAKKSRCAECHSGGGLVMKELNTPWVHWEGESTVKIPGAADLVAKHKDLLGTLSEGSNLETQVVTANRLWAQKKVEFLKTRGTAELLRPLFCTVQLNLQSGSAPHTTDAELGNIPETVNTILSDFWLDPVWGKKDGVPVSEADYRELIGKDQQKIKDQKGAQLKDKDGHPVADTFFPFTYPERAAEDADYVKALVKAGVVDDDFVKDVLAVDFTRPIFSDERCSLLTYAPSLSPAELIPEKIRAGFLQKLKEKPPAPTSPAGVLLAHLEALDDAEAHARAVDGFLAACRARPQKELLADVLQIASMLRSKSRKLKLLEFTETMPFDTLHESPKALLDAATCKKIER